MGSDGGRKKVFVSDGGRKEMFDSDDGGFLEKWTLIIYNLKFKI